MSRNPFFLMCVAVAVGTGIGLTRVVPKIWNEQP